MKENPLFELYKALNIELTDIFGVQLPVRLSEPSEEYYAARNNAALFDLSFRGMLKFSGEDRIQFLQGMITNDVKALKPNEGAYAAFLTAKGGMISDLRIFLFEDSILMDLNSDKTEIVLQTLNRYLISEDVEISDVSEKFGIISIQGPKSAEVLNSISSYPIPSLKENAFVNQALNSIKTINATIVKTAYSGEEGFDLIASNDQMADLWKLTLESGEKFDIKPAGVETLNILRVEAGIPVFGIDMDESTIPLEAPIEDRTISYTKGCYIGQEIIARLKYRGRPNKFLVGLKFSGDFLPMRDDPILKEGRQVGRVTSAVFSYSLSEKIGLGYVHRGIEQPGNELLVVSESKKSKTCVAKVAELPFYKKITA